MNPFIQCVQRVVPLHLENKIYVITYHGLINEKKRTHLYRNFNTVEGFTKQLRLLKKYPFLTLDELLQLLQSGNSITRPHIVFTFDDGYRNNLIAADILKKFSKPAAFFISAGYAGGDNILWTAEASLLLLKGSRTSISFHNNKFDMPDEAGRVYVFRTIRNILKELPAPIKNAAMHEIRNQYTADEYGQLRQQFNEFEMLNWKELREMSSSGFDIGSHGFWHELHHAAQPEHIVHEELKASKNIIESYTGKPCMAMSFPNGNFRSSSAKELEDASYKMAFTNWQGVNDISSPPLFLNRISSNNKFLKFKTSLRQLHRQKQ